MTIELTDYYDRSDPAKHYDQHLFLASRPLQSAELNEIQTAQQRRLRTISDVLFHDGAVMSGADVLTTINDTLCTCDAKAGAIYVAGAVRGVTPRVFTCSAIGVVAVGVRLTETVVTALEDATLYDPAIDSRNQGKAGAARLRVEIAWGHSDDGQPGDFYPVYTILDGVLQSKQPPPQVDAVSLALARYDRQSAGGMYVSNGLQVTVLPDTGEFQVYSLSEGVARINGEELSLPHGRRFTYATEAQTNAVTLEQHRATGGSAPTWSERVTVWHTPIAAISQVAITKQATVTKTRGSTAGSKDYLSPAYTSVQAILSVVSGETTYTPNVDYILTNDAVDWSPAGAEPGSGVSYTVTFQYIALVDPETLDADATSFLVSGAVANSWIQVSYTWKLPRYDILCLDETGTITVINGLPFPSNPQVPAIPSNLLPLARITQDWLASTRAVVDIATRMVPMQSLNAVNRRIDALFALVAEERLKNNLTMADQAAKKGVFVDPFIDDDLRDQGIDQTAAIIDGKLTLGIASVVHTQSLAAPVTLTLRSTLSEVLSQLLRTGSMKVNPYDAFAPLPAVASLQPAVDIWTDIETRFLSPVTRRFYETVVIWDPEHGPTTYSETIKTSAPVLVRSVTTEQPYLRPIPVQFEVGGFGAGEQLVSVTFDGILVTATAG
jgi:hypothetical protein